MVEQNPICVLVSLHRGYGIGDACMVSVILQHIKKYRPWWRVDYQAEQGKHQVGRGLVANHFAYGQPYPSAKYDAEVLLCLYDKWYGFTDRPNTHVVACLKHDLDIEWDRECGRYQVQVSREAYSQASPLIDKHSVAIHYRGDSDAKRKDLEHEQAAQVCNTVTELGFQPMIMDWRDQSPLRFSKGISTVGGRRESPSWGRSVEMNCAVIEQCDAFVGIDSGPAKCASATDTPSLVVWTGHHPAQFHDPSPNTTHLVPYDYHSMLPVGRGPMDWFDANYQVRTYNQDPLPEIHRWLSEVLR